MPTQPTPEAFAKHSFEYDAATLDSDLANFIQIFYTWSDDRENAANWADCFTEDAGMKKIPTHVKGRDEIAKVNLASWRGQASRHHNVLKVYPFCAGQGCTEVMLTGISNYVYEDGKTGEMAWAARLVFERTEGEIAIKFYNIFPSTIFSDAGLGGPGRIRGCT